MTGVASPLGEDAPGPIYRGWFLFLLMLAGTLCIADRQLLGIVAIPVRRELGLTNTQVGLATGFAFALLYTGLGVPIAWLADRYNRVWILVVSLLAWSAMTVLSGRAHSFGQLFLARAGVGVGEAGYSPASLALVSDLTAPEKRASRMAMLTSCLPLGALVGLALGGWVAQVWGWRWAFYLFGAPGLLVALVAAATLREPPKVPAVAKAPPLWRVFGRLARQPAFIHLVAAVCLIAGAGYAQLAFLALFLSAAHHLPLAGIGLTLGLTIGLSGVIGALSGGLLSDLAGRRGPGAALLIPAVACAAATPFWLGALLAPGAAACIAFLAVATLLGGFWSGPVYAGLHSLVAPRERAVASAFFIAIAVLAGAGLGPLAAGALADALAHHRLAELAPHLPCAPASPGAACAAAEVFGYRSALVAAALLGPWASLHLAAAAISLGWNAGAPARAARGWRMGPRRGPGA